MGWDLGDGVHEGWASCVSADGRFSLGSSSVGVMVEGITGAYPVHDIVSTWEVVPYAEVIGWRGECACGWLGQLWERVGAPGLAEVAARWVYDARGDVPGAVEEDIEVEWARHAGPAQAITAVAAAAGAVRAATRGLDEAVLTARRGGAPWTDIGRGVGITRQSAHQRGGPWPPGHPRMTTAHDPGLGKLDRSSLPRIDSPRGSGRWGGECVGEVGDGGGQVAVLAGTAAEWLQTRPERN